MSLPVPITVRLATSRADMHVGRELRDFEFRSVAPGGYASARFALNRPMRIQPDEIEYFGRVVAQFHGATVWDGYLAEPGRTVGDQGEVWDLAAFGPSAHASDREVPYVVVDRDLSAMRRVDSVTPMGRDQVADDPAGSGGKALVLSFPRGMDVVTNDRVLMRYGRLVHSGQKLARVSYSRVEGVVDVNHQTRAFATQIGTGAGADMFSSVPWTTVAGAVAATVGTWTNGRNALDLQAFRSGGAGTFGDDIHWASIRDLAIRAMLVDATGSEITAGYTTDTVLASDVVKDLLGRLLPLFDGAAARITPTAFPIEHLAYPDGITARGVLSDLMLLEPGFYWAAWERLASGRHRFEYIAWPTEVRYEADTTDGYESTGSAGELYDAVQVGWTDVTGEPRLTRRTQVVPELVRYGSPRERVLDLGDEVGTEAQAERVGDMWLAEHRYPPNAGRLTVARPVLDLYTGRRVWPWEIKPGNLIRVRGVRPRVDALNPTGRDGVTIFRIFATSFRASRAAAALELDSYPPSVSQALAALAGRVRRRRR